MKTINLIFPNQLFKESVHLDDTSIHYLIEEELFFNHFNFHKQKLYFHRCSMKNYYDFLSLKKLVSCVIMAFKTSFSSGLPLTV